MFREKYKDYNENIRPSEELIQETVANAKEGKKMVRITVKRNVIAACLVLALGITTVSVDAATGGAIRKALGFEKISVYNDNDNAKETIYQDEKGDYVLEVEDANSGWKRLVDPDTEVLAINFRTGNTGYHWSAEFFDYMSGEDIAWTIYKGLTEYFGNQEVTEGNKEGILEKLEACADEYENENYKQGIHMAIDDLKNDRKYLIYESDILEKQEGEKTGETAKVEDVAWYKIDLDMVTFDSDGWGKFEADSVAGAKEKLVFSILKEGEKISEIKTDKVKDN